MTLQEWMQKSKTDIYQAAEAFECSIFAVRKWLRAERRPRTQMQAKIRKVTKGDVNGDDWLPREKS